MLAPTTLVSVPAKSVYAERINPFPTAMDLGAGKTITRGMGKPVPYKRLLAAVKR